MADLNIVEKVIALEGVDLLRGLDPAQLASIAAIATEVRLPPGKVVLEPGKPLDALFVVLDGGVSLAKDGAEIHAAHQNEVLGAWALFDDEPMPVTATTIEDTRLLRISRDDFYELLSDNVEITTTVFGTIVKRFRKMVGAMSAGLTGEPLVEMQRQATLGRLLASVVHEISAPAGTILANRDTRASPAGPPGASARRHRVRPRPRVTHRLPRARTRRPACRGTRPPPDPQFEDHRARRRSRSADGKRQRDRRKRARSGEGAVPRPHRHDDGLRRAARGGMLPAPVEPGDTQPGHHAAQSIDAAGTVTAGTRLEGETIHIWIADTGHGIREEDKAKCLKQEFTTKPLGVGTGLGLSIVQRIVTGDHHGAIDSKASGGRGTTFHIRIPLRQQKEPR